MSVITRFSAYIAGLKSGAKLLEKVKPKPKRNIRNFYIHGYIGESQPDGSVTARRIISNGPWWRIGGFDLDIYMRTSPLESGAVHVLHLEGRADLQGKLTLKVMEVQKKKTVVDLQSWRDGVPAKEKAKKPEGGWVC